MDLKYYKLYCIDPENIENYEKAKADNFKGWSCHHRLETHNSDGERRLVDISMDELKALGMYWNRPASELIFLTESEHHSLHMKCKPKTEETRKKMSEMKKCENNPMYGKHHSAESIQKISEAMKGENHPMYGKHHSKEAIKKNSEAHKGKRLSKEHINKIAEANRGKHWYNNGKENKFCFDCPPGFIPGRLRK